MASASSQVKCQPHLQQPLWKRLTFVNRHFLLWVWNKIRWLSNKHEPASHNICASTKIEANSYWLILKKSMLAIQSIFFSIQHSNQTSSLPATAQWTLSTLHKAGTSQNKSPIYSDRLVQRSTITEPYTRLSFKQVGWHEDVYQLSPKGKVVKSQASHFPFWLINTWINLVALSRYFNCANNIIIFCCCKAAQLPWGICCFYFGYDGNIQVLLMKSHSLLKLRGEKSPLSILGVDRQLLFELWWHAEDEG